ncbi:MAG: motility protein A [Firmicutes bacterium]|nr:motility protein A [Bacillota bacterium]
MMKRFDILTIAGVVFGLGLVLWGILMESELSAFINLPGIMITLGGSFGAMLINFEMGQVRQVIKITMQVLFDKEQNVSSLGPLFVKLAQKARREGLLALEDDLEEIEDPFLRNGLQMVIDGFEPDSIRDIMDTEIQTLIQRHQMGQNLYRTWGTLTPAFGMIGTLIGLVQMLSSLDNPDAIGPGMAVALLTTFYGVLLAYLIFNPVAGKLAIRSEMEVSRKVAIIDAVLALQAGVNPRILQEKLKAYLSPQERELLQEEKPSASALDGLASEEAVEF